MITFPGFAAPENGYIQSDVFAIFECADLIQCYAGILDTYFLIFKSIILTSYQDLYFVPVHTCIPVGWV